MNLLALLLLGALTPEQWRQDVAFFAKELPARHISPFTRISRELPDRTVRMKFSDYMAGRDPVLDSLVK